MSADYSQYDHIGAYLAALRAKAGETIDELAARTRLKPSYIVAIEEDDQDSLPGAVYARGYVRSYAEAMGQNVDTLLQHFSTREEKQTQFHFYYPKQLETAEKPNKQAMHFAYVLIAALLCAWMINGWMRPDAPEVVRTVPVALLTQIGKPVSQTSPSQPCDDSSRLVPCYWAQETTWPEASQPLETILELGE